PLAVPRGPRHCTAGASSPHKRSEMRPHLQKRGGSHLPANRKRLVVPTSMGAAGFELLKTRDDVEVIPFPPSISSPDFNALLRADGEVNGAILGLTRFGETEAQNAKGLQVVS